MSEENAKKEYEERLRRRLQILKQQMSEGKVHFAEGLNVIESLKAVRTGPDGEIDLSTVDGLVRSAALAVTEMYDREELKKMASLSEIQNAYFGFIEKNFSSFYKIMQERKLTPHQAGLAAKNSEQSIKELTQNADEIIKFIDNFWGQLGEIAHIHVEDMHTNIKGIFGGDLFPSHQQNIASKCGVYVDTIILPDPFLRSKHLFIKASKADQAYYLMKHAMNILQYKDLACAAVSVPIVILLPDISEIEVQEKEFNLELGKIDSIKHSGKLFGRDFKSFEEVLEFAESLDTVERTVAEISDGSRVLFDTEWQENLADQLRKAAEGTAGKLLGTTHPGQILALTTLGRMSTCNELLIKARRLNGTPIMDAPTSWQYLVWKMEYDSNSAEITTNSKDLHITRGLQELGENQMEWLGNVPVNVLIELRKQDALGEIRNMLGAGVDELVASNPTNFHRTRDQLFDNIHNAFNQHKENIKTLRSKQWRFAGSDIGTWLVTGTLGITAAATGTPVWAFAALAADQVLNAPKLKEIPKSIKALIEENNKLQKSPVGILFNLK